MAEICQGEPGGRPRRIVGVVRRTKGATGLAAAEVPPPNRVVCRGPPRYNPPRGPMGVGPRMNPRSGKEIRPRQTYASGSDTTRTGWRPGGPLRLGGIDIPHDRRAIGHSDADVLLARRDRRPARRGRPGRHRRDVPRHRPGQPRPRFGRDAPGRPRRGRCGRLARSSTSIASSLPSGPSSRPTGRPSAAGWPSSSASPSDRIGLKAKTGEHVGAVGREEAIAAQCVALIESTRKEPDPMIRVYNTLSKTKEPFEPVQPGKVGIYLCGPTVYKPSHIGHMVGPGDLRRHQALPRLQRLPGDAGRQHHRRGRQADRRVQRPRHPHGQAGRGDDGRLHAEHRGPGRRHHRPLPQGHRAHRRRSSSSRPIWSTRASPTSRTATCISRWPSAPTTAS